MDNLYISVHIPKTAGESLKKFFIENVKQDQLIFDYGKHNHTSNIISNNTHDLSKLKEIIISKYNKHKFLVVHGHFNFNKYFTIFPNAKYITFFRNPLDLIPSLYFFLLRNQDKKNKLFQQISEGQMNIKQFASLKNLSNFQTRFINHRKPQAFDFIGITDQFSDSVTKLGELMELNIKSSKEIQVNKNTHKGAGYILSSNAIKIIKSNFNNDFNFYNEAKSLLINNTNKPI